MDDSNLRRGRPTSHVKFSQSSAILASYGLMILGFELVKGEKSAVFLSRAMGARGVVAGEFEDLRISTKRAGAQAIKDIHLKKTACLFVSCCEIAGFISGARGPGLSALKRYGRNLGFAFQLKDDMLSLVRSDRQLGKQTKQDKNAPNLARRLGMKKANAQLYRYIKTGKRALKPLGAGANILGELIEFAGERKR